MECSNNGLNWAENVRRYNAILNEEVKEQLDWKSQFEIYSVPIIRDGDNRSSNFVSMLRREVTY